MGQPIPIQAPLRGLNTLDPFIEFESGYARELTNYAIFNGAIPNRFGLSLFANNTALADKQMIWVGQGAGVTFYGIDASTGAIYNIDDGTTSSSVSIPTGVTLPTELDHLSLRYVVGVGAPRLRSNPFTAWTFTTLAITATSISSACSHKGRLYVCDGSTIEYSIVGQVTGAMFGSFPISNLMQGQRVLRMFSITAQPGNNTSNVFVVFGDAGLVLVYSGDYPAAPNWTLIGNFMMPAPGSRLTFVEKNGDILVSTVEYCYWFRDLFSGGSQTAFDNRPSAPIDNLWKACIWQDASAPSIPSRRSAHAFYYAQLNCIIIQCFSAGPESEARLDLIGDYNSDTAYFVYSLDYKAWSLWLMAPFLFPVRTRIQSGVYYPQYYAQQLAPSVVFATPGYMVDEAWDGSNVTTIDIETSWKTPYYYPQNAKNRLLNGTKPFFKNTVSGYLHLIRAIQDMSDYNAPFGFYSQSNVTAIPPGYYTDGKIDVPAKSSKIYSEFCGVGGDGAGYSLQYTLKRKAASSATQAQQIFNSSANFDEGAAYP